MKKGIHPENYRLVVFKDMSNDNMILTKSCASTKETVVYTDGKEYPVVKLEISNTSHPFFTGKLKLVDTAGRVDKFMNKYKKYAKKAEDQALADLFLTIRTKEEEHLETINQLMQGTVPMMSGGSQGGQSSQPGNGKATKKSDSKTDEYLLKDALDTEKHVSSVYDTCIFEFTDAGAREALNHIQKEEQEHGQMLYDYMVCHGMCA